MDARRKWLRCNSILGLFQKLVFLENGIRVNQILRIGIGKNINRLKLVEFTKEFMVVEVLMLIILIIPAGLPESKPGGR